MSPDWWPWRAAYNRVDEPLSAPEPERSTGSTTMRDYKKILAGVDITEGSETIAERAP